MNDGIRYDDIESALFDSAVGKERTRVVQSERRIDAKTGGVRQQMVYREQDAPNVQLALKLLDQRIGGPQDYC